MVEGHVVKEVVGLKVHASPADSLSLAISTILACVSDVYSVTRGIRLVQREVVRFHHRERFVIEIILRILAVVTIDEVWSVDSDRATKDTYVLLENILLEQDRIFMSRYEDSRVGLEL